MWNILKCSQLGLSTQYRIILQKYLTHRLQQHNGGREFLKNFHCSTLMNSNDDSTTKNQIKNDIAPNIATKYERFTDDKTTIILDMEEEREKLQDSNSLDIEEVDDSVSNMFEGLNTERGKTGVFDIEDLVAVLKRDNAVNIFVATVPKQLKYVDYMVIITGRSHRHMKAMAEFVRKMYKVKMTKGDIIPKIEGKNSDEWMAMDLGNIALHIFSADTRKKYDLEMLWSVGTDYDTESNKPSDPIYELFDQHSIPLSRFLTNRKSRVLGNDPTETPAAAQMDDNSVKNQSEVSNVIKN